MDSPNGPEICEFGENVNEFSQWTHADLHYLMFNLGSFLPRDACRSDRSRKMLKIGILSLLTLRYSRERVEKVNV